MDRRRLVAALVVVGVLALAGCSQQVPETEVVCDGCVSAVDETASETNRSITVEESVTHVYLRKSGDGSVEARMQLGGSDADDLRVNDSLLARVRERVASGGSDEGEYGYGYESGYGYEGGYGYGPTRPAFERRDLDVEMEGRELVVAFRVANLSERRLGATLSEYFFRADGDEALPGEIRPEEPWEIETGRLVVHGPGDSEPMLRPEGASVEGDTLVWQGGETVDTRTYLVFGSGVAGGLHARAVVATEVFLWATPTAVFGAVVPMALLFCLTVLFALRYPGYVADGWDVRRDPLFWLLAGGSLTCLAALAGLLVHSLVALAFLVATPVAVAGVWLVVRPDDATVLGGSDAADGRTPDATAGADSAGPGAVADESATDDPVADGPAGDDPVTDGPATDDPVTDGPAGDDRVADGPDGTEPAHTTESVVAGLAPGRRTLVATAGSVAAVLVVTAVVAADYQATVTGPVAIAAGIVPFVAFPTLGYAVTLPDRTDLRSALVVAASAAPWLAAFPLSVQGGTEAFGPLVVTFLWGLSATLVGLVLFYGVLWVATR